MERHVDDSRPPYLQVAEDLRAAIKDGKLKPGERLPSARELTKRYKIASMTAQSAIRMLRDEGLVYSVQGRGTFVRHTRQESNATDSGAQHSAEFLAVIDQVEAITDELHRLADRVAQLEALAQQDHGRGSKRSR